MSEASPIQAIKGMNDVRPGAAEPHLDSAVWSHLFSVCGSVLGQYGYHQVWLPCVEDTGLFARGIGEDTDIVSKEMYTFSDRGERSLTLRPEGTAGAVRAYIEHNLAKTDAVQRWWYGGPMFRAERPQKGRYRQFHQIGAELFGVAAPTADAEMLHMLYLLSQRLGVTDVCVGVNSVGDAESRRAFRGVLREFLRSRAGELCQTCLRRLDTNPMRVLDCKEEKCRGVVAAAPDILVSLTDASRRHFERVLELAAALGVPLTRDPRLVRGLDYYTGTTFELTSAALGAQDAILGGGRYDDLVAELGGPATPAVGFAAGVERLALLVAAQKDLHAGPDLYIIPMMGTEARSLELAQRLRGLGPWQVEVDVTEGRLKKQMRRADRLHARAALVLGETELASGHGKLKDLAVSSELEVELSAEAISAALHRLGSARM
jgi:histidyl-tRNA synthetase